MSHTFIVLDGHPAAFVPTTRKDVETTSPTHQLPPIPLWASMVKGTMEFCRVAWDIQQAKKYLINVLIAGETPKLLNNIDQQSIQVLEQQFPHAQPRQTCPHDRLKASVENALKIYIDKPESDALQRCRLVLVIIAKEASEKLYEFRNNAEDQVRDVRSIVYDALATVNNQNTTTKKISHVEVDVLRLLPHAFPNQQYPIIPAKIISKQVSPHITISVHNIPNGENDFQIAMKHLSQLYYNINVLHISNIPMKSAGQTQSTHTVTLFYQANGYHLINQKKPLENVFIHDPSYLEYRQVELIYTKRSKRALSESEWCTCMHSISPIKLHDLATEVYLDMTFKGSISYLMTPEMSFENKWTHILMVQEDGIFLHCLNSKLQQKFAEAESEAIDLLAVKMEPQEFNYSTSINTTMDIDTPGAPKISQFVDALVQPNLYQNVKEFMYAVNSDSNCRMVPLNPLRFSHHLPIMRSTTTTMLNEKGLCTSRLIEKASRWCTCFRDCEGTDRFPITNNDSNNRSIEDLAVDVLNGIPISTGFGVAYGLIHDLFEQLQDIIVKDVITRKEITSTHKLIDMIVNELNNGMKGTSQKMFIKGLRKDDARLLSKKLLIALYLVGKRFLKDSPNHAELCDHILSTISSSSRTLSEISFSEDKNNTAVKPEGEIAIDNAWNQVQRYENMSLREKSDAAQGYLPEFKQESKSDPNAFHGQLPPGMQHNKQPDTNPNFRGRRVTNNNIRGGASGSSNNRPYNNNNSNRTPIYPDPSVAIPYLEFVAPTLEEKAAEEESEEASLGKPGSLLWLYWMNDKVKKRGNGEEGDLSDGTEMIYKNKEWKRVKKEFLGRIAQPGEKGETD